MLCVTARERGVKKPGSLRSVLFPYVYVSVSKGAPYTSIILSTLTQSTNLYEHIYKY